MDQADTDSLRQALATQVVLVGQHDKVLKEVVETPTGGLTFSVSQLGGEMDQMSSLLSNSRTLVGAPSHGRLPKASPAPKKIHCSILVLFRFIFTLTFYKWTKRSKHEVDNSLIGQFLQPISHWTPSFFIIMNLLHCFLHHLPGSYFHQNQSHFYLYNQINIAEIN